MKLYNFTPAANALRVEMFLNEKNIKLEISLSKFSTIFFDKLEFVSLKCS